ncbi:alkaline phosphatase family protein [Actinokineospora diospyrosa]|uniref:Type I phosphodiesterase / nucleotide pyrophosphatase n=1 Tax=Actinokineospora diospyrosa TaxID=103728 RepID=A0ABT1IME0_9PSEU|nr:alkaline phosphatase family protein [Actinokineospora diospyrosa]MCP2273835.1 Type I phosphodiesterase / nucleotide pyrophosphatase [Actinokineospora diospyrosa]
MRRNRLPALFASLAVAAGALLVPALTATAAHAAAKTPKVLVIGIDGLLFDRIAPADAPTLDSLIATGSSSKTVLYDNPFAPTLSGPGWATLATGTWPDKHRVLSNSWGSSTNLATYPDFLTRIESARPALSTFAAATWDPLVNDSAGKAIFSGAVDARANGANDTDTTTQTVARLRDVGPDASFVVLDDVDAAGHNCGAATTCYLNAIAATDQRVKQFVDTIRARATYPNEDWTILVSADHGHTDAGGHGGLTPPERASFIIRNGPGTTPGTPAIAPKNVDVAPTVLSLLGVAIPAALDGRVLGTATGDPFDGLIGSLQTRVDETGIPTSVRGWTKTTPSGWIIDNSAMGTGGMAEWRGWSFATDDFWTRTETGQSRENNVRARGVFAVADSDEWSDKATSGAFNSALTSPAVTVSGKATLKIGFSSHYRKEGNETATVTVSFDGGAAKTALTYTGDAIAKIEALSVAVPAGAQSAKVTWRLSNGANNWYWAVDAPTFGTA